MELIKFFVQIWRRGYLRSHVFGNSTHSAQSIDHLLNFDCCIWIGLLHPFVRCKISFHLWSWTHLGISIITWYNFGFELNFQGNHIAFSGIPSSLMRTFSMMLGELDYIQTFVNPYHCVQQDLEDDKEKRGLGPVLETNLETNWDFTRNRINCTNDARRLPHPFASFGILGVFMVFMPILLMNLLIGLAVGDIDSVRRNAQLKRLAMQVNARILK